MAIAEYHIGSCLMPRLCAACASVVFRGLRIPPQQMRSITDSLEFNVSRRNFATDNFALHIQLLTEISPFVFLIQRPRTVGRDSVEPCYRGWRLQIRARRSLAPPCSQKATSSKKPAVMASLRTLPSKIEVLLVRRAGDRIDAWRVYSTGSVSRKPWSWRIRVGCRILRRAFASIWRIRSRVTLNCLPTSSSVRE